MKIGCPKEVKDNENRIGLTPNAVHAYVAAGHTVYIEKGAGAGSAVPDEEYAAAGAVILPDADAVWSSSDMIVKVKEPMPEEYGRMRENQIIYTYFHFAANETLTRACMEKKIIALAYETVEENNNLPLLKPMSEVAGRMAALMGAFYLAKPHGGRGTLPMGVTGLAPADVLIIGGGVVGINAARVAAGYGANVTILDVNLNRLEYLGQVLPRNVDPIFSDEVNLKHFLGTADIVVGAVLIPGAVAPKLIKREYLKLMKPGSVLVDVAIDQGGCSETSRPTTHSDPIYVIDNVVHYCVANMPGAYARTATFALNNATIRYGLMLANKGAEKACRENQALKLGLNMYKGSITFRAVAEAFGLMHEYRDVDTVIA
ncbi:Alanine dehydrogenase [uncultured delta proteobacterium]|uniref:Alanine dehydrogenase n=1 Tax=uncultured delta proteobacterium TaxID=34034 RepID=A0A212J6L4_9DELT|nr:Alanine dehydrogenase [uncultured delta proteobacterium]